MSELLPDDYLEREQALDPLSSFCVTAPAGSGKTELLIQRFLTLLARVADPQEVLAITFTRKAAAEMRERVYGALEQAVNEPEPAGANSALTWRLARAALEVDRERGWLLLENPTLLNIKTIDGFCSGLTRQLPVLSSFGAAVSPIDDAWPYYREAAQAVLASLERDTAQARALGLLMLHFDNNWQRLEELFAAMLAKRDQWLPFVGSGLTEFELRRGLQVSSDIVVADYLRPLAALLAPLQGELQDLLDYSRRNLGLGELAGWPQAEAAELEVWRDVAQILLTNDSDWRKKIDKRSGFPAGKGEPAEYKERWQALLEELQLIPGVLEELVLMRSLPRTSGEALDWQLTVALGQVLPVLAAQLVVGFAQAGVVDHVQVSIAAREALGSEDNPTELAMRLDYSLSHILLDEFQDTAAGQYSLMQQLTRGWAEYNAAQPENPRTFFIVGDGMQSIYGFRDANVGLFMRARALGFNGVRPRLLSLTANFRSRPELVGWVNDSFRQVFPQADNVSRCEVSFTPAIAQRETAAAAGVALRVFDVKQDPQRLAESRYLVDEIAAGLADPECQSMAVLVRGRAHLVSLIKCLDRAELPWRAEEIHSLASSSVVGDLLNLCAALHNQASDVAWAALLRGPWCGLALADLLSVATLADAHSWWQRIQLLCTTERGRLGSHAQSQLDYLAAAMKVGLASLHRMPLRYVVEELWLALGGPAVAAARGELEDAEAFLSLLDDYSATASGYRHAELEARVTRLYAQDNRGECKLQLMTLHKSKGLEFDWVFIPAMEKQPRAETRQMLLWDEYQSTRNESAFLLALDDRGKQPDGLYEFLRSEQKRKQQLEGARLLYVGCTRARTRLVLTAGVQIDEASGARRPPPSASLASCLGEVFDEQARLLEPAADQAVMETSHPLRPRTWVRHGAVTALAPLAEGPDNIPPPPADPIFRHVGTVVHLTLQRLSGLGEAELTGYDCNQFLSWWEQRLGALGVSQALLQEAVGRVRQSVTTVLGDEQGRYLVSKERKQAQSEYRLSHCREDGRLAELIVDRTFVEGNVRWIIDYKNSAPEPTESMETFLEREAERYTPQLAQYAAAFSELDNREIKCALYFTSLGYWLPLAALDLAGQ